MQDRWDSLLNEHVTLESMLSDPDVLSDQNRLRDISRRYKELTPVVECINTIESRSSDGEAARELLAMTEDASEKEQLKAEKDSAEADVARLEEELKALLLPKDPNDGRNVIVELRGAEGGEEANLFARDLFEMYRGFATKQSWKFEIMDAQVSDLGGYSDVTFRLAGEGVWSKMKHEGGVHRVQRVPVTESQGRVHTSSATVTVLPEADEVDVVLDPNELRIDVYRSSGPGGQSVNTTDSAVRITHIPTGVVVAMQDEKSQIQNREKAMRVLRSRLLQAEQEKQAAEASGARKAQTGSGGRSEKVRTYNFKENRLTDHRIGLTLYKLDKVLGGDLDEVVDALVADERATQLRERDV